jgi:hypothetical protein
MRFIRIFCLETLMDIALSHLECLKILTPRISFQRRQQLREALRTTCGFYIGRGHSWIAAYAGMTAPRCFLSLVISSLAFPHTHLKILLAISYNPSTHMKTTFDLPDPLLDKARRVAASRGTTVKALVEAGLRKVIEEHSQPPKPFKLKNASIKGSGLQPAAQGLTWAQLLELSYEGRGA